MGLCSLWAFVCHCTDSFPTTRDKGCRATIAFTTTSHSLCTALIASRDPRFYNTASLFTMRLSKVTMPFKLRHECEGSPCCLSRRAGQHLGVVGRDSRSRFTWHHVNTTTHTRPTSPSGLSRTTIPLSLRKGSSPSFSYNQRAPYALQFTPYTSQSDHVLPSCLGRTTPTLDSTSSSALTPSQPGLIFSGLRLRKSRATNSCAM